MSRYLIEVSLPEETATKCASEAVRAFGSHFPTHANWQTADGVSTGTLVVEADEGSWALSVVPPNMLSAARISKLTGLEKDPQSHAVAA